MSNEQSRDQRLTELLDSARTNESLTAAFQQYQRAAALTPAPRPTITRTRYSASANS